MFDYGAPKNRNMPGPVPIVFAVTGHCDIPLTDVPNLETAVITELEKIKTKYPHSPRVLLTGLAEGADRLVARCALERGWSLGGVLALPQAEFEKDFKTEESLAEFRYLLGRCDWIREVAPAGCPSPECYARVGVWMSVQAQWLIALWDGTQNGKKGGTGWVVELFREGSRSSRPLLPDTGPVIHITTRRSDSSNVAPQDVGEVKFLMPNPLGINTKRNEEKLWSNVLSRIDSFNKSVSEHRSHDFSKTRQYLNLGKPLQAEETAPYEATKSSWLFAYSDLIAGHLQSKRNALFLSILALAFFGLMLEKFYSSIGHSVGWLLWAFVLGSVALFLAKVPIFFHETDYMDYRSLAEACRVQYFWKRAGVDSCAAQFQLVDQREELEWIRQAVRTTELGPDSPRPPLGKELLESVLACWIRDQKSFYIRRCDFHKARSTLLNALALWFFCAAGIVILATIWLQASGHHTFINWMEFSYGLLLALSGTVKVYLFTNGHEEHARSYLRMSQSMSVADKMIQDLIESGAEDISSPVREILREVGRDALEENSDWLLLHRDRLIEPPIG